MTVSTVEVNVKACYNDGPGIEGARVVANLQSPSQNDDGYIVPRPVEAIFDENGCATLNLWPNENGDEETFYKIEAFDCNLNKLLNVVTIVPESAIPLDLEDIALPIDTLSLGQASGNVASIRRIDTKEGIIEGGDLSTNRCHRLDLSTLTTEELVPLLDWVVAVQDPNQPDSVRFAKLGNLPGIGFDTLENSVATEGQTKIPIEAEILSGTDSIDLYIDGKYQCPPSYDLELLTFPPYHGQICLSEPLEEGDDICVKIKQNSSLAMNVDAYEVGYNDSTVGETLDAIISAGNLAPFQEIDGNHTAAVGERLFIDTSSGPISISLPAFPNIGDSVLVIDITPSSFITNDELDNPFTLLRNGERIMELEEDFIVDQGRVSFQLFYAGTAFGWRLSE